MGLLQENHVKELLSTCLLPTSNPLLIASGKRAQFLWYVSRIGSESLMIFFLCYGRSAVLRPGGMRLLGTGALQSGLLWYNSNIFLQMYSCDLNLHLDVPSKTRQIEGFVARHCHMDELPTVKKHHKIVLIQCLASGPCQLSKHSFNTSAATPNLPSHKPGLDLHPVPPPFHITDPPRQPTSTLS